MSLNATTSPTGRRFLHLWAPRLSTDRARRERPDWPVERPLALVAKTGSSMRAVAVDAAAEALGVQAGLTLKDARARAPQLLTAPFDAAADARLLQRLLALCRRFTPSIADPSADELALDVSGTAALFDGEAGLLSRVVALFAGEAVRLRPGLADTPGLARAMARFADDPVAPSGGGEAGLASLPIEALSLSEKDAADLRGLGFRRVGEVMARPRALLAEALEGRLGLRLDELLGYRACPLALRLEPVCVFADRRLPEAVSGTEAVLHHVRRLAEVLEVQLDRGGRGGRVFRLTLFGDGPPRRVEVRSRRALTRPREIAALFARRFEGTTEAKTGEDDAGEQGAALDQTFDQLRLEALLTEPLHARTGDLWDDGEGEVRFEAFVQSLAARFGREAVEVIRPDSRTIRPEGEAGFAPLGARPLGDGPAPPPSAWGDAVLRPLRLFDPPQPIEVLAGTPDDPPAVLVWRRLRRRILKAEGPERLAAEWGRAPTGGRTRDYYRVEDAEGRRYWLFRHGLFGEGEPPRWYLHGLFA